MISDVHWDDPNFERHAYEKWTAYGQSKTANVLFTIELERRLGARGVHAYAVHPGMIMTELGRHLTKDDIAALRTMAESAPGGGGGLPAFKSIPAGAATSVWAATAPELARHGGRHLADCALSDERAPWATDADAARRLWTLSEQLVRETFRALIRRSLSRSETPLQRPRRRSRGTGPGAASLRLPGCATLR